jgi:DNA-binding transcriptional LysR family regulator
MGSLHRYKELRLGQLRAFCAVARSRSFSAAARALHISHPVVWQQVRAVERDFGGNLLQLRGHSVELTEEGRRFFELASPIVAAMDSLHQAFEVQGRDQPTNLAIAGSATVFTQEMAQGVVDFCRQNPRIQLSLLTGQNPEIEELVATGEVDAGVMPHDLDPTRHPLLVSEVICVRPWHLIMPEGHPLSTKRRIAAADLVVCPLILAGPENDWRKQVDAVFAQAGVLSQLRVVLQVNNSLAAGRYVSLGLGLTITPYGPRGLEFPNVVTRRLDHLFPDEHLVALLRRGATPRPQVRRFIDFTREYLTPG